MGHIYEIQYLEHRNYDCPIQKLDKDSYFHKKTGEVFDFNHIDTRADDTKSVKASLKKLRDYINANIDDPSFCKWVTLTYRQVNNEPMRDTKKLYKDFKNFFKRFRYKFGSCEYIIACEPQQSGAWHIHALLIFPNKAPYIPNKVIEELWGQGFTKTQKLANIDNIGAYLTAYLGDMPLEEAKTSHIDLKKAQIKTVSLSDSKIPKKFVKGARMVFYPPNFNLYRISRGVKKPINELLTYKDAKKRIGNFEPTYSTSFTYSDSSSNFSTIVAYEHYNIKRF